MISTRPELAEGLRPTLTDVAPSGISANLRAIKLPAPQVSTIAPASRYLSVPTIAFSPTTTSLPWMSLTGVSKRTVSWLSAATEGAAITGILR